MFSKTLPALPLLLLALALTACGGSDDAAPAVDTGLPDDVAEGDAEPIACELDETPADGDTCACEGGVWTGRDGLCDRTCACTNGFFVCEDECETAQPVTLGWSPAPTLVEVEGNGDRDVNPGEIWSIEGGVEVLNSEAGVTTTVRATTASGRLTLDDDPIVFENLGDTPEAFAIELGINATASAGRAVVRVEAFTDGFEFAEQQIEVEIVELDRPVLSLPSDRLEEVEGDGNLVIDAGETWKIIATVRNAGTSPAEGVTVTAAPSSAGLTLDETSFDVGILSPGATRDVEIPFSVPTSPSDLTPSIDLAVTASNAATTTRVIEISIRPPDTLRFDLESATFAQAEGEGNDDELADPGEVWELILPVSNQGSFAIPDLEFTLRNYATPLDPETGEPITDPETGLPIDDPAVTDLGFVLEDAPSSLDPEQESELRATVEIADDEAVNGRVLITPRSSIRQHAPLAYNVLLARP